MLPVLLSRMRKTLEQLKDIPTSDERLIYQTQVHGISFLWPVFFFAWGLLVIANPQKPMDGDLTATLAALTFLVMAFVWDKYNESNLTLTDKRVILKTDVIGTQGSVGQVVENSAPSSWAVHPM